MAPKSKQVLVTRCPGASHYPVAIFVCCISLSRLLLLSKPFPLFFPRPRKRARNIVGVQTSSLLSCLRPLDDFVDVVWWRLLWEVLLSCEDVEGFRGARRLVRIDGGSSWTWRVDGEESGYLCGLCFLLPLPHEYVAAARSAPI